MGVFSGLRDASRGYSSNPLRAGQYLVRIDACDSFEAKMKGLMWKTTMTVLKVLDGGEQPHRVGEQVQVFYKKGQYPELFLQNIKAFLAGVMGVADEEVGEEDAELVLSDENPMAGLVTIVTARYQAHKTKKEDNGDPVRYVVPSWSERLDDDQIIEELGEEGVERFFPNGLGE